LQGAGPIGTLYAWPGTTVPFSQQGGGGQHGGAELMDVVFRRHRLQPVAVARSIVRTNARQR
jgi:hypothetical protein